NPFSLSGLLGFTQQPGRSTGREVDRFRIDTEAVGRVPRAVAAVRGAGARATCRELLGGSARDRCAKHAATRVALARLRRAAVDARSGPVHVGRVRGDLPDVEAARLRRTDVFDR